MTSCKRKTKHQVPRCLTIPSTTYLVSTLTWIVAVLTATKKSLFRVALSDLLPSDCGDHSLIGSSRGQSPSRRPWRKGYLPQNAVPSGPQQAVACHETLQSSVASDATPSLLNPSSTVGEAVGLLSLMSATPPATPTLDCGGSILSPNPVFPRELNDQRPSFRKQIFSPSLMNSTQPRRSKMAFSDTWTQRLQNFNLNCLPLSPPSSDVLVEQENIMTLSSSSPSRDRMVGTSPEMLSNYDSHQSATVNAPTRQGYLNDSNHSVLANSSPSPGTDMFHSPHLSVSQPMHAWHSDALGASTIQLTPDIHGHDLQPWWPSISPPRVSQALNQPLYSSTAGSPIHEKTIQDVSHPSDLLQGGLMTHFDQSLDMSSTPESSIPFSNLPSANNHEPLSYSSLPTLQNFPHVSGCGRTAADQTIIHQSRSPTPTSFKSGTANRDALDGKSNSRRVHHRKVSSQSTNIPKPAGRPFEPTSPKRASKTVNVSFVNFTPEDSHKILTGVAPSGSSKTKARREQEAKEKRRKLSEAALMAVRNAGGDVEALEAVLC